MASQAAVVTHSAAVPRNARLVPAEVLPLIGASPHEAATPAVLLGDAAASALAALDPSGESEVDAILRATFSSASSAYLELAAMDAEAQRGLLENTIRRQPLQDVLTVNQVFGNGSPITDILLKLSDQYQRQGDSESEDVLRISDATSDMDITLRHVLADVAAIVQLLRQMAPPTNASGETNLAYRDFLSRAGRALAPLQHNLDASRSDASQIEKTAEAAARFVEPSDQPLALLPSTTPSPPTPVSKPSPEWFKAFDELFKPDTAKVGRDAYYPSFPNEVDSWITRSLFRGVNARGAIGRMAAHSTAPRTRSMLLAFGRASLFPKDYNEDSAVRKLFLVATKTALILAYRIEWGIVPTEKEEGAFLEDGGTAWLAGFPEANLATWSTHVRVAAAAK